MTNFHKSRIKNKNLLYPKLSYELQKAFFNVANKYGCGLKEKIYQNALAEEFVNLDISFIGQKRIDIYSIDSGKILGIYVPDFIIDNKIILEIKSSAFTTRQDINQQRSYLQASIYEVGYLVNFGTHKLFIQRSIYTNNRKSFIALLKQNHDHN